MTVYLFGVPEGHYFSLPSILPVYFNCTNCKDETPQKLLYCNGNYVAICSVCCGEQKFGKFVLCAKCKIFVEAFGFIVPSDTNKLLVINNPDNRFGGHQQKYVPRVIWSSSPIVHICGQVIEVPP